MGMCEGNPDEPPTTTTFFPTNLSFELGIFEIRTLFLDRVLTGDNFCLDLTVFIYQQSEPRFAPHAIHAAEVGRS